MKHYNPIQAEIEQNNRKLSERWACNFSPARTFQKSKESHGSDVNTNENHSPINLDIYRTKKMASGAPSP
jgi:hypothetical protein